MPELRRVVLIGPESTGKTELARAVASHFGAELSREYVREYAEVRRNRLSYDDNEAIGRGQVAVEDEAIAHARARGARLVVHDTDLLSTVAYHDHYYGRWPAWMEAAARERLADLYLLMDVDVPWVPDPARDQPHDRAEALALFARWLDRVGARWTRVSGDWAERQARAAAEIAALLEG